MKTVTQGKSGGDPLKKMVRDHIAEAATRVTVVTVVLVLIAGILYANAPAVFAIIQKPLGQTLFYSTPGGGFTFTLKLCISLAIISIIPLIVYNILRYISPVFNNLRRRKILLYTLASTLLAYAGATFAYYVTLPAALVFLTSFEGDLIKPLINVNDYYNFVLAYLIGFAFFFQLPLLLHIINTNHRLKLKTLLAYERHMIVIAVVAGAVCTPTPDPLNQLLFALPIFLLYQISIITILISNKGKTKQPQATTRHTTEIASSIETRPASTRQTTHTPTKQPQHSLVHTSTHKRTKRQSIDGFTKQSIPKHNSSKQRTLSIPHRKNPTAILLRPRSYIDIIPKESIVS